MVGEKAENEMVGENEEEMFVHASVTMTVEQLADGGAVTRCRKLLLSTTEPAAAV